MAPDKSQVEEVRHKFHIQVTFVNYAYTRHLRDVCGHS
jgi:hypothetical protein